MKKLLAAVMTLAVSGILIGTVIIPAIAQGETDTQIPNTISYQGYLSDDLGNPVTGTGLEMQFTIYEGSEGNPQVWQETQFVDVTGGLFSVLLGSSSPMYTSDFTGDFERFLGVKVGDDEEMTPRQKLTTVPYVLLADQANYANDADTIDGMDSSAFADGHSLDAADGSPTEAVYVDNSGDVGIGTTNPSSYKLKVEGDINFTGNLYQNGVLFSGGGGDSDWMINGSDMYSAVSGNVGIGDSTPNYDLDVYGGDGFRVVESAGADSSFIFTEFGQTTWDYANIEFARIDQDSGPSGYLQLSDVGTSKLQLHSDGVSYFDGGNVGIGTTTPDDHLNVGNSTGGHLLLTREDAVVYGGDVLGKLLFGSTDGGVSTIDAPAMIMGAASEAHGSSNKGGLLIFSTKLDGTAGNELAEEQMRITADGKVGIGITSPEFILDIGSKMGINGTQILYLPDQTDFEGTLIVGDGGGDLHHAVSNQGRYNTAVGLGALSENTTGFGNTAGGYEALPRNEAGEENTAYGYTALVNNRDGCYNTGFGSKALFSINLGHYNTAIGCWAGSLTNSSVNNCTMIGYNAQAYSDNQIILGNDDISSLYCRGAYVGSVGATNRDLYADSTGKIGYVSSSERYKDNITDMDNIDWIYNLRPVNFVYKADENQTNQYGLIAEEVETINPDFVSYNDEGQAETVSYSQLITPMLKAIQEQQETIEELLAQNKSLIERLEALEVD